MLERSAFFFSCLCGHEFQTEHKDTFQCPDCRRLLVIEWRPENDLTQRATTLPVHQNCNCLGVVRKHTNEKISKCRAGTPHYPSAAALRMRNASVPRYH